LSGPVSGILFDAKAHALRPMLGVPGASYLGGALVSGIDAAAVSPDGVRALAVADGRLLLVTGFGDGAPQTALLDGAIAAVDRIAWSPDGAFAAVSSSSGASAQLIRDAARNAATGPAIDVPFALSALAVGTDGEVLAGGDAGVYLLAAGSAPRQLAAMDRASALAVRGSSVYAAAAGSGQVWLIENYATSPAASIFAGGVDSPVGMALAADGKRLFVASSEGRMVRVLDTATHATLRQVELDIAPTQLSAFGGRDVWLLNAADGADPLYVATGGDEPAAWFVPAGREQ
jgi:hypothetical protein